MLAFNSYLNFPGTAEEAFNFYKSIFGGEFAMVMRFGETPDGASLPEDEKDKIMHIALPIGKGNVLMASDAIERMGQHLTVGTNFYLSVHTENREEADDTFKKLSDGGAVEMPMTDMFWGDYFGMLKDKFDIKWMITFSKHQPQS